MVTSDENFEGTRFINREAAAVSGETIRFSFGANWKKYIANLDEAIIQQAENGFKAFTKLSDLKQHTFLDLGCGSGLSSLIAYRLGAKRIVSVDVDPNSLDCVTDLRARFAKSADHWEIIPGSALDPGALAALGRFSYVYSWGVLHHTGAMWQAVENVVHSVEPDGMLHLALYGEHKRSAMWLKVKRLCNRFPRTALPLFKLSYALVLYGVLLSRFQSPITYHRQYADRRGMTVWRDIEDWMGGLPYEYCKPDQAIDFLTDRHFSLLRLKTTTSFGCNEFLFHRR